MNFRAFLTAIQFLTVFPVRFKEYPDEKTVGLSLVYYPVIGLLIGCVLFIVGSLLSSLPSGVLASVILIVWVVCSGALHLDGLADSADAFMAGHSVVDDGSGNDPDVQQRDRILTIMKDPRSGPIAIVTLIMVLLLKFTLLQAVIENSLVYLLLLAPFVGRSTLPILLLTTDYVRKNGSGTWLVDHAPRDIIWPSLLVIHVTLAALMGFWLLSVLVGCGLFLFAMRYFLITKIGGTTGDTAGAALELMEPLFLLLSLIILT